MIRQDKMKAVVYHGKGVIALEDRPVPQILKPSNAIVRVTRASICSSDLHIKHGTVAHAREGIILGHEFTGIVEEAGASVRCFSPGDRVAVSVESFCGSCFYLCMRLLL
jgi:alcohol dehydrogenase